MQEAHITAAGGLSTGLKSRARRLFATGVVVVGTSALVISPVTPISPVPPTPPALQEAQVSLAAAENPFALFGSFFAETALNLQLLGINASNSAAALPQAVNDSNLLGELVNIAVLNATNPTELLTRLLSYQATYADDLQVQLFGRDADPANGVTGFDGVFDRLQEAIDLFGPTLLDIFTYETPNLGTPGIPGSQLNPPGMFTQALFEANFYFVLNILDIFRPLAGAPGAGVVPFFSFFSDLLGGEPAGGFDGALPGVNRLDNLLNVLNEQNLVRALAGPFQNVGFQAAAVLDDAMASLQAGNPLDAALHLFNLPIKVVNAFVNGYTPVFSTCSPQPCSAEYASLIDATTPAPGGLKYLLVDLPNLIINSLVPNSAPVQVTTPPTTAVGTSTAVATLAAASTGTPTLAVASTSGTTAPVASTSETGSVTEGSTTSESGTSTTETGSSTTDTESSTTDSESSTDTDTDTDTDTESSTESSSESGSSTTGSGTSTTGSGTSTTGSGSSTTGSGTSTTGSGTSTTGSGTSTTGSGTSGSASGGGSGASGGGSTE